MSVGQVTQRALAVAYGVVIERLRRNEFIREYLLRRSTIGYWLAGLARRGLMAGSGSTVSVPEGFLMHLDARDNYGIQFLAGNYEPGVTSVIKRLLRPGACFVDLGAHHGYYTVLASRLVGPTGHVYAFEPEPANYRRLTENVSLNRLVNVTTVPKAVSDANGSAVLHVADKGNSGSHSLYANVDTSSTVEVEVTSLDTYFGQKRWPTVDVVKMDVEGSELAVLDGMETLLDRNPQMTVLLEFFPRALKAVGLDPRSAYATLSGLFDEILRIEDEGPGHLAEPDIEAMLHRTDADLNADNLLVRSSKKRGGEEDAEDASTRSGSRPIQVGNQSERPR